MSLSLSERRDEGTYYCVSKNELGITRGNIQVFSEYLVQPGENLLLNKIAGLRFISIYSLPKLSSTST